MIIASNSFLQSIINFFSLLIHYAYFEWVRKGLEQYYKLYNLFFDADYHAQQEQVNLCNYAVEG